jgi:hypothetical protein
LNAICSALKARRHRLAVLLQANLLVWLPTVTLFFTEITLDIKSRVMWATTTRLSDDEMVQFRLDQIGRGRSHVIVIEAV